MNRDYIFQLKLAIVNCQLQIFLIPDVLNIVHLNIPSIISVNKHKAIVHSSCETGIWFYFSIYSKVLQLVLFLHVFQINPSMDFSCLHPSHSPCLVRLNKISKRIRIMKIFIALLSPLTWYVLPLRSGYLLQRRVLKHPQPIQFSACFCQLQLFICNILLYNATHV